MSTPINNALKTVRAAVNLCHSQRQFASVKKVSEIIYSVRGILFPEEILRELIIAVKLEIVERIWAEMALELEDERVSF